MSRFKCPYPKCNHVCDVFTSNHCESVHGMNKNDLVKKYGEPILLRQNFNLGHVTKNPKFMQER